MTRTRDELVNAMRSAADDARLKHHEVVTLKSAASCLEKHTRFSAMLTEGLDHMRRHDELDLAALAIEALQWDFKARGLI